MTPVRALRAEWTKLRTLPATALLPPAAVVATAGLSAAVSAAADPGTASCADGCDPARLSLSGVYLGQLVVVALAVLASAGEYRHGLVATTLMAVPSRLVAFTAKALAVSAAVLPAALLAVTAALASGRLLAPSFVLDGRMIRAGGGTVAYLVLIALFALGVAATLRRTAAALGVVLGLLYVAPVAAQFVTDERWRPWIERVVPTPAGLTTLAAWTAGALTAGALTFTRRDA